MTIPFSSVLFVLTSCLTVTTAFQSFHNTRNIHNINNIHSIKNINQYKINRRVLFAEINSQTQTQNLIQNEIKNEIKNELNIENQEFNSDVTIREECWEFADSIYLITTNEIGKHHVCSLKIDR